MPWQQSATLLLHLYIPDTVSIFTYKL